MLVEGEELRSPPPLALDRGIATVFRTRHDTVMVISRNFLGREPKKGWVLKRYDAAFADRVREQMQKMGIDIRDPPAGRHAIGRRAPSVR